MKILIVITKSEIGGAQVFVLNLASSLKKLGFDVEVAAGDGEYLSSELPKSGIKFHLMKSLKRNINVFSSLYFIIDLYRLIKNRKYDVIHFNSTNTLMGAVAAYALRNRPKLIFTFHGLSFLDKNYEINSFFKYVSKLYFKTLIKIIDKSVFVSELNLIESKKEKVANDGLVIYNGLDEEYLSFLSKNDARTFLSEKVNLDLNNSFLLGSTGRLAYQKNYEFLIRNFGEIKKKFPDAKLIIIGDGPDKSMLQNLLIKEQLESDVILAGAIKDSYMYIKAFDLFVLPSRYEGLSISLIEAIFAELPLLISDVGGNCEVVDNDKNQLYGLDNIEEFINKIIYLKENKSQIIDHNIKLKERFSLNKMVAEYISQYE